MKIGGLGVDLRNFTFSSLALISLYSVMLADSFGQAQPPPPPAAPILSVYGAVARADADGTAHFDLEMLRALPAAQLETTTAVTDGVRRFDGVLMRDLLAHVGAQGKTLTARALNDYAIDIAIEEFDRFDVLVAYEMDGEPLLPSDKGPLWIVYPRDRHAELQDIRFDYRWVWQLRWIEIR